MPIDPSMWRDAEKAVSNRWCCKRSDSAHARTREGVVPLWSHTDLDRSTLAPRTSACDVVSRAHAIENVEIVTLSLSRYPMGNARGNNHCISEGASGTVARMRRYRSSSSPAMARAIC